MSFGSVSNDGGLIVYQKALQFVMALYGVCKALPRSEEEHLTKLIKKAAMGVTSHISEGGKQQESEKKRHCLRTAVGYLEECAFYLNHAAQQGYVNTAAEMTQLKEVNLLMTEYIDSLATE